MPKKKAGMTPEEQSEKFRREVQRLIDAGELIATEADDRFQALVDSSLKEPKASDHTS